jgi:hypothetical protein
MQTIAELWSTRPAEAALSRLLDYSADVLRGLAADYYNRRPSPISNMFDYPRRQRSLILWTLGILALALRLAPLLRSGSDWTMLSVDSPRYVELAEGLRAGCGFARLIDGHCDGPEVFRTPGYPLFLMFIPSLRAVVAVQAFIGAALCVLVGSSVALYWGTCAGAIAELLLVLDIPTIVEGSQIMSDVLFQALLAVALFLQLWLIAHDRYDGRSVVVGLVAAFLLAVDLLVRPVGILLPLLAPLPFLFLPRAVSLPRRMGLCLAAFALPAMVMGGWMARNAARTGTWTLSTNVAINLYYNNAEGVVSYLSDKSFPEVMDEFAREVGLPDAHDYADTPAALAPQMASRAWRILLHHPIVSFILTARAFAWLVFVPDRGSLNQLLRTDAGATSYLAATEQLGARIRQMLHSPLLTTLVALQFALIVMTWIGVGRVLASLSGKTAREVALILIPLSVALSLMILAAGPEAYARYRMPAAPFLAMLAGIGWCPRAARAQLSPSPVSTVALVERHL